METYDTVHWLGYETQKDTVKPAEHISHHLQKAYFAKATKTLTYA